MSDEEIFISQLMKCITAIKSLLNQINTSRGLKCSHLLQVWLIQDTQIADPTVFPSFEKSTSSIRVEKYQCPECSYTCSRLSNFTKHCHTHTGKKPFSCSECPYQTSYKSNLMRHLSNHSGEKHFSCPYCSFCSDRKCNLLVHVRIHN